MSHRDDYLRGLQDARTAILTAEDVPSGAAKLWIMILTETQRLQGHKKEMKRALDALRPKWPHQRK